MQMDEADLAARTQLTQIIDTKIQGSISTTASRVKEMGLGTGEELGTLQTESVRRSLINKRLKIIVSTNNGFEISDQDSSARIVDGIERNPFKANGINLNELTFLDPDYSQQKSELNETLTVVQQAISN